MRLTKRCRTCGEDKPESRYYRAGDGRLRNDCCDCSTAKARARYHAKRIQEAGGPTKRVRVCVVVDEQGRYAAATEPPGAGVKWMWQHGGPVPVLRTVWVEADVPLPVVDQATAEVRGEVTDG